MTLFEYLAAAYVLMLSFAVLRGVSGVPHAMRAPQRYWIHLTWLLMSLVMCALSFWLFWAYRDVEWTFFKFMTALAIPALLYTYTSVLVPPDPAVVTSWRTHFFQARVPLFASAVAFMVAVTLSNQSALELSPLHTSQLINYAWIALFAAGLFSAKPAFHGALAGLLPVLAGVLIATLLTEPDSLFSLP